MLNLLILQGTLPFRDGKAAVRGAQKCNIGSSYQRIRRSRLICVNRAVA